MFREYIISSYSQSNGFSCRQSKSFSIIACNQNAKNLHHFHITYAWTDNVSKIIPISLYVPFRKYSQTGCTLGGLIAAYKTKLKLSVKSWIKPWYTVRVLEKIWIAFRVVKRTGKCYKTIVYIKDTARWTANDIRFGVPLHLEILGKEHYLPQCYKFRVNAVIFMGSVFSDFYGHHISRNMNTWMFCKKKKKINK